MIAKACLRQGSFVSGNRGKPTTGGRSAAQLGSSAERFVAWCKQEQASIEQELELLVSGKVRIGAGWIDRTADSIERAKGRLAQLNEPLTEEGKTTVVKPDSL